MKCEKAQRWILLEQSGELAPRRRAALEQHLVACPDCRAWRALCMDGAALTARAFPAREPAEPFVQTVLDRMPPAGPVPRTVFWRTLLACAAALLAGLCLWPLVTRSPSAPSPLQAQVQRIDEIHALASLLSEEENAANVPMPENSTPDAKLRTLAEQLLILQGLAPEDSSTDETATSPAGTEPTVLREHSIPAVPSERCV